MKRHPAALFLCVLPLAFLTGASACSSTVHDDGPSATAPGTTLEADASDTTEAASPAPTAPSPAPTSTVPREFTCDATAVTADTQMVAYPFASDPAKSNTLLVRPSGAPCANHLVVTAPAPFGEHVVSTAPGMIALAHAAEVAGALVVCLSNEKHSPSPSGEPNDRYSDSVQIECASRDATGTWSTTVVAVPGDASFAAWAGNVIPVPGATDRVVVRWMRDSFFQFLHMVPDGRPATDGVYETELTISATGLSVGATTRVPGDAFQANAVFSDVP
ncbi:MAG: hypothetical protein U0235_02095 [Polyangiaceae bacterium]